MAARQTLTLFVRVQILHPQPIKSKSKDLDFLGTDPNFNTNAPPFKVRGCKVNLGGAYLSQGVQIEDTKYE